VTLTRKDTEETGEEDGAAPTNEVVDRVTQDRRDGPDDQAGAAALSATSTSHRQGGTHAELIKPTSQVLSAIPNSSGNDKLACDDQHER
jgi:hypothetical protein